MKNIYFMRRLFFIAFFSIYSSLSLATLPRPNHHLVKIRVSEVLRILFPRLVHHLLPNYELIKDDIKKSYYKMFNLWADRYQAKYFDSDIKTLETLEKFVNDNKISEYCDTFEERVISYVKYYREHNKKQRPITLTHTDLERIENSPAVLSSRVKKS